MRPATSWRRASTNTTSMGRVESTTAAMVAGTLIPNLRHGVLVGGGGVVAPGSVVERQPLGARADRVARGPSLVLALVGEQGAVVDVAKGVEPGALHSSDQTRLVDIEPGSGGQVHGFQADVVGARRAPGGEHDLIGLHPAAVVEAQGDRTCRFGAAQPGHRDADAYVRARLGEPLGDRVADEPLHPGQQRAAGQQGDLGAEALPQGGHFHAHPAAADDGEPAGYVAVVGALAVGPGAGFLDTRHVGQYGSAAGGDGDRVPGGEGAAPTVGRDDGHPARSVDPALPAEQGGADGLDPVGLPGVVPVGDVVIAPGEDLGRVEPSGDRLAGTVDPARVRDRDDRPQQRLAGDAGPVRALPADQFALDHGDGQPGRAGMVGGVLADRARSEHDHVIGVFRGVARGGFWSDFR